MNATAILDLDIVTCIHCGRENPACTTAEGAAHCDTEACGEGAERVMREYFGN